MGDSRKLKVLAHALLAVALGVGALTAVPAPAEAAGRHRQKVDVCVDGNTLEVYPIVAAVILFFDRDATKGACPAPVPPVTECPCFTEPILQALIDSLKADSTYTGCVYESMGDPNDPDGAATEAVFSTEAGDCFGVVSVSGGPDPHTGELIFACSARFNILDQCTTSYATCSSLTDDGGCVDPVNLITEDEYDACNGIAQDIGTNPDNDCSAP